jgi:cell division protein FtsB
MRRRRVVSYALFAGSLVLVVNALVGENGYLATIRAERESAAVQQEVMRLRLENQALRDDIDRLNTDPAALEEAARRTLGMIKPGETVVILKDYRPPEDRERRPR